MENSRQGDCKKLFSEILYQARLLKVTDVIFREGENIYYRIHDDMVRTDGVCSEEIMGWLHGYLNMSLSVADGLGQLDIDASFEAGGRYRINLFTSEKKRCSVVRIINDEILPMAELGIYEGLPELIHERRGINLIAGKTSSGKSTTMASLMKQLSDRWPWHIITLEDPIEYRIQGTVGLVTQRELGTDFLTFREGIKSALRQSPDLIMIGEIRDIDAVRAALAAAESGTGVLATMHSLGAEQTISRLLAMYPGEERDFARYSIAAALNFIQSQVLRRSERGIAMDYELLIANKGIAATIREGRINQLDNLILLGKKDGMKQFNH